MLIWACLDLITSASLRSPLERLATPIRSLDPQRWREQAGMFARVWKCGTKFFTQETIEAGILQGIFVDVFPYDHVYVDEEIARKQ